MESCSTTSTQSPQHNAPHSAQGPAARAWQYTQYSSSGVNGCTATPPPYGASGRGETRSYAGLPALVPAVLAQCVDVVTRGEDVPDRASPLRAAAGEAHDGPDHVDLGIEHRHSLGHLDGSRRDRDVTEPPINR